MTAIRQEADQLLASLDRWPFGGLPYGLEPLALPLKRAPRIPLRSGSHNVIRQRALSWQYDEFPQVGATELAPDDDVAIDRLFWFRWITGHQATFILWQLLACAITDVSASNLRQETLGRAQDFVRGYSLMLLYSSSCPRRLYESVIRPTMARHHPAFSGSWARDYTAVRSLLRGRTPLPDSQDAHNLTRECELNAVIHDGVAMKLVPTGPSLMQSTSDSCVKRNFRLGILSTLYDSMFLIVRGPVSYAELVFQLIRRLEIIRLDIATNGLYPACADSEHEEPSELMCDDVMSCKNHFLKYLAEIGDVAIASCAEF